MEIAKSAIKKVLKSMFYLSLNGLMITTLAHSTWAQQSAMLDTSDSKSNSPVVKTTEPTTVSNEELLLTIKLLEKRIAELESKMAKETTQAPAPTTEIQEIKQSVEKINEETKKNSGILSFFQNTELTGFVDAYYGYNFNRPTTDNKLRNFDTKHNQFSLNLIELALEKKPTPEERFGFRVDVNFGPATEIVHASEPGGSEVFKHFQQGYLSFLAPVGNGLQVDIGKFVTPAGAEVIESKENWNYSRSLLFVNAIPYYHFGARATYPVNSKVTFSGFISNGWNDVVDNNNRKTFGISTILKPTPQLTITENYIAGPEQPNNNDDWRQVSDTIVTYVATPHLSLMANYDYGTDRSNGASVHWTGIAAYARVQANSHFGFTPRFEWYDDHDGFTTGTKQELKEITLTNDIKLTNGLTTFIEYRRDFSDTPFFAKPIGRLVKAQSTFTIGIVYSFSSRGKS